MPDGRHEQSLNGVPEVPARIRPPHLLIIAYSTRRRNPVARISVNVDGVQHEDEVEPRVLLVHYLRDRAGKIGTVVGCDTTNCGSCTVLLDGVSVKSCTVLAVQADGSEVTTIEGLAGTDGGLHPMQQAFHECHALQCGYCTPGMIMAAVDLLSNNADPSETEIRAGLEGNMCRCTGYENIVRAVQRVAKAGAPEAAASREEVPA
jgi:carbon-monoxide dehydrogenase small subunit